MSTITAPDPAATRPHHRPRPARTLGRCFCGRPATQVERASIGYRGELIQEQSCDDHAGDDPGLVYAGWGEVEARLPTEPQHRRDASADSTPAGLVSRCLSALGLTR